MSEQSKSAREANKAKAKRLADGDPHQKVDASSWHEGEAMNGDAQVGARPVSPRAYKRGGTVKGEASMHHAGRKPRKSGGIVDDYINRDAKEANAELGKPHIGAFKRGGHASTCKCDQCAGGRTEYKSTGGSDYEGGMRPTGGRMPRKDGGRAKGKTNINIIIAGKPNDGAAANPQAGPPMPPRPPMPMPAPQAGPPGMPAPMPGGAPMGPGIPPGVMPRKSGGRAYPIENAAGGARGRLEKIKSYGAKG